jgi:hypothetical protein
VSESTGALLRGVSRLAFDTVAGVTGIVEAMHADIAGLQMPWHTAASRRTRGITGLVYRSIGAVTRGVRTGVDLLLRPVAAGLAGRPALAGEELVVAALNGAFGDHLEASANPLALPMTLRHAGQPLRLERAALRQQLPAANGRIVLLLHGLCMSDLQWTRAGASHADRLQALGHTVLHLRYNSGRHVSVNGRELAALLEQLVEAWPVPVAELSLLCHSMGGLVARSACHYGAARAWRSRLRALVFLGTPHHGAPLERAGNRFEAGLGALPFASALARLGQSRSAGITDLRHGNLLDADWQHGDRFARQPDPRRAVPLPAGVRVYAAAALRGPASPPVRAALPGDGLVPLASALGEHSDPAHDLGIPPARRWVGRGRDHFDLLHDAELHAQVAAWLTPEPSSPAPRKPRARAAPRARGG